MGWVIFIIIAITTIYVVVKVRQAKNQFSTLRQQNSQPFTTGEPLPPRLADESAMLSDPAMKSVATTAWHIGNIERGLDISEINAVRDFISAYTKLVPHSEEFCKYESVIGIANNTFIHIFRKWPKMLYKSTGFVGNVQYFITQLDIHIRDNLATYGNKSSPSYDPEMIMDYQYLLDTWCGYPSEEAQSGNIPVEQTNWWKVTMWLAEKAEQVEKNGIPTERFNFPEAMKKLRNR
jgi:hypothetical protein